MIVGFITVVRCDGVDCNEWKSFNDTEEETFQKEWFAGLTKHFCPKCRGRVENAAAIVEQERRLREISDNVWRRVTSGHTRRPHVH